MVTVDAYLKAVAAATTLAFAIIVAAGGPRKPANQFLALFLLAIAGNQTAETMRAITVGAAPIFWFRVATFFAAVDPFFLYYFASLHPTRSRLNRPGPVLAVAAISLFFVSTAFWQLPREMAPFGARAIDAALVLFTGAAYTVALTRAFEGLRSDARATMPLVAALAVAAIPVWGRLGGSLADLAFAGSVGLSALRLGKLAAAGAAIAAAYVLLRADARRRAPVLPTGALLVGTFVAVAIASAELAQVAFGTPNLLSTALGRGGAAVRWLLFGAFASVAVLRHRMLGLGLDGRRRAARLLVAVVLLATAAFLAGLARAVFGVDALDISPVEVAVLLIALALSQGVRGFMDRMANLLWGVPPAADPASAHAAYQAAARRAISEGRALATDADLARLRDELGLDARSAAVLARMAEGSASGPLAAGQVVAGRYRIERLLGRGGGGRVFLARDELLLRDVVLKEIEETRERDDAALSEARIAGSLQHPNVVTIFDLIERPGAHLLVQEHLPGGSLADRLGPDGRLPGDEALDLVAGVLAGLSAVHAKGIVHRDVKAANILLAADGTPKVADFGIARVRRSLTVGAAERPSYAGSPEALAPEQRAGEPVSPATDVYQVALLMRRLSAAAHPPAVAAVVARALAEKPAARYPDAAAMLAALAAARGR